MIEIGENLSDLLQGVVLLGAIVLIVYFRSKYGEQCMSESGGLDNLFAEDESKKKVSISTIILILVMSIICGHIAKVEYQFSKEKIQTISEFVVKSVDIDRNTKYIVMENDTGRRVIDYMTGENNEFIVGDTIIATDYYFKGKLFENRSEYERKR